VTRAGILLARLAIFLALTFCIPPSLAGPDGTPNGKISDETTSEELIRFFDRIALRPKQGPDWVHRWHEPVRIARMGPTNDGIERIIKESLETLRSITGHDISLVTTGRVNSVIIPVDTVQKAMHQYKKVLLDLSMGHPEQIENLFKKEFMEWESRCFLFVGLGCDRLGSIDDFFRH